MKNTFPPFLSKTFLECLGVGMLIFGLLPEPINAISITGGTNAANNRFSSGFPNSPVESSNSSFVGLGYDWSGVAWSTQTHAASSYKGFGMLSPIHFLTAQHYEYSNNNEATTGVRVLGLDDAVTSQGVSSISNLGQGLLVTNYSNTNYDLALGTLNGLVTTPQNMARLAVLDLNNTSSSTTFSNYVNLEVFLYGRGSSTNNSPRTGIATVIEADYWGIDTNQTYLRTNWDAVQLQAGDSGSPVLHGWTNPNGGQELTVLGLNTAAPSNSNYLSFMSTAASINAANNVMTTDGFALRVDGNTSNTWVGSSSTSINNRGAWGLSAPNNAPSDKFVLFDAATAGNNRAVTVNSNHNLRGLYFKATASSTDGFTFGGANTLTIGRGGVTNYDLARQTFNANLALGDHQYWVTGAGGITANNINTNGRLLEIAGGAGTNFINGNISGAGALALSGGRLELGGANAYSGLTWVHEGLLVVNGSLASPEVRLADAGRLGGTGTVNSITGSGFVEPGNSPGILTANDVDPSGGLGFRFEFTAEGSPDYSSPTASINDVLRLTSSTPFVFDLDAANTVEVYFNLASISLDQTFRGGFFTDESPDFFSSIENATYLFFLADDSGSVLYNDIEYSLYTGPFSFVLSTIATTANFGSGDVEGRVMQFTTVPEPGTFSLFLITALIFFWRRRKTAVSG